MKLLIQISFILLLTSCDIFRKSNRSYSYSSSRDSSSQSITKVDLTRVIWYDGTEVLMDFDAQGFRVIRVSSDGQIETEGEGGKLTYRKSQNNNVSVGIVDSSITHSQTNNVSDSVRVDMAEEKEYHADPDTWVNWWWVFAGGTVLLIGLMMILRKLNVKSLLKW